jgi:hypothetical protein
MALSPAAQAQLIEQMRAGDWQALLLGLRGQSQRPHALDELSSTLDELTIAIIDQSHYHYDFASELLRDHRYRPALGQALLEQADRPVPEWLGRTDSVGSEQRRCWFGQLSVEGYQRLFEPGRYAADERAAIAEPLIESLIESPAASPARNCLQQLRQHGWLAGIAGHVELSVDNVADE